MNIIKTQVYKLSLSKKQRLILVSLFCGLIVLLGLTTVVFVYREASYQRGRNQGWTYYKTAKVSLLAVDPQGRVWAAQSNHRIVLLQSGAVTQWPEIDDANGVRADYDEIQAMAFDSTGRLWINTTNIPLAMLDTDGKWIIGEPTTDYDDTEGKFIYQIVVDGHDQVWLTTVFALGKVSLSEEHITYSFQKSDFEPLGRLAVDKKGSLWTLNGNRILTLNEQGEWVTQTKIKSASGSANLVMDSTGQAWIVDEGMIYRLSAEPSQEEKYGFGGDHPFAIDQQGQIWIGEYPGLRKIDTASNTTTTYDALNSGVEGGYPNALVIDPDGRVWVSFTLGGVSVLDPTTPLEPETVQAPLTFTRRYLPAIALSLALVIIVMAAFLWPAQWQWGRLIYFALGVSGWFIVNGLIWQVIVLIIPGPGAYLLTLVLLVLTNLAPLASYIALIVFSLTRPWLALGIFAAIVLNSVGILLSVPATDLFSSVASPLFKMIPFFFPTIGY